MSDHIVWRPDPDRIARSHTKRFMDAHGIDSHEALHRRSVAEPEWFWDAVVTYLGIPFSQPYQQVKNTDLGVEWTTWFTGGRINLSQVCVDRWAAETPEAVAVISEREDGGSSALTYSELADRVARCAGALIDAGIGHGDAVAVALPMSAEAVIAFLAVARIGAVFVPIFSGYGADAMAARLTDPPTRAVICADGFFRRGRLVAMKETTDRALERAGQPAEVVLVVRSAGRDDAPRLVGRDIDWQEALDRSPPAPAAETDAEDPVVLAYTSGTTGRPKGAVHVHGGLAVKIAAEGAFQTDLHPGDRLMWATDMGWIMGPWMVIAGLANGASIVTYDGSPDHPGPDRIWEIVAKHRITVLGLSPTFVRAIQPHGAGIATRHDLSSLRSFGSTGEPWNPDPWWWLFRDVGGERVPIVNISGGTEIGACLLSVELLQGLKPTSLGMPSLGVAAEVLGTDGRAIRGSVGELAVLDSWPGMTRGFWGERQRYLDTYWNRFDGVWVHGDWASVDEDGFWFLHGRSDDTLNVAGKRIGPAEIESVAVGLEGVMMAAAIGIPDDVKGERIAVYVVTIAGTDVETVTESVSAAIVDSLGKAFRPVWVKVVDDLPRTRSAKIMRRVVRSLVLGEDPGDLSSLENPGSLDGIRPVR